MTSPTYTIVSEYRGRLPLYHIDLYRIDGDEEFENLGLREILDGDGVAVVEWSEKMRDISGYDVIRIRIRVGGPNERSFDITGIDP